MSKTGASLLNRIVPFKDFTQAQSATWWRGFSNAGALGNAKYPFIAIAPKSNLARVVASDMVLSMGWIELFDI